MKPLVTICIATYNRKNLLPNTIKSVLQQTYNDFEIIIRKKQLKRFKEDRKYRERIELTWEHIEPVYRIIELFRMNLAKHCAPGKDGVIPRAPGYGRINRWCGAMDNELVEKNGYYTTMNRRDIADALRKCIDELKNG